MFFDLAEGWWVTIHCAGVGFRRRSGREVVVWAFGSAELGGVNGVGEAGG